MFAVLLAQRLVLPDYIRQRNPCPSMMKPDAMPVMQALFC